MVCPAGPWCKPLAIYTPECLIKSHLYECLYELCFKKENQGKWQEVRRNRNYNLRGGRMSEKEMTRKNLALGTSLVAQWLRIHLPMQGTRVWALVREDPTCRRTTKPVRHNYWACGLEPASHNYWALVPQLLKPTGLEPMPCNKRSHCDEKPMHRNEE